MATQDLRNQQGQTIAKIDTDSRGVMTIKTFTGKILGTYDPKSNITRNYLGQLIGTGNLLATLIEAI